MKRGIAYLSFLFVSIGVVAWAGLGSAPQAMQLPFVLRQASTPGNQETGNINVSGTIIGGQFVGGGAGLTGLDASNINAGTLDEARLPTPLSLSGSVGGPIISGQNASTTNGASGVQGLASAGSGGTFGGYFQSDSTTGTGVYGRATSGNGQAASGGYFQSDSTSGVGVYGRTSAFSGVNYAVYGDSVSTSGTGVVGVASASTGSTYGGNFYSASSAGHGVAGRATANDGPTIGVYGETSSPQGFGFYGIALSTTGFNFGGYFESDSPDGRAVRAANYATTGLAVGGRFGSASTSGMGVWSTASATSGVTYGVFGESASASGYGVWAQGRFGASGTKSFRIDHPLDPENKYLLHYSAEGPEPQNIYNGTVTTDAKGEAWIDLPDYYATINKSPRYQLTVVDDTAGQGFVQVKVARKIKGNRFMIMTSAPNVEVSWEVKALRNDRWMQKYGAPVEVDKEGLEKGTYQHPELYGEGPERGLSYEPKEKATRPKSP